MKMKSPHLLLFYLSLQILLLPSSSSSSADLYRSHVIDHFLQKTGGLDTFFTENSLDTKESSKRNAGAGTLNALDNNYLRSQENYPHIGKYSGMNVYEYPETQSPAYRYNLPSTNIYRGSSSITYQGSPTPSSYQGMLEDTQPTTSPTVKSFLPPLVKQTPSFQSSFQTSLTQSKDSPPGPYQPTPAPKQPHHPTSPPSLYQSFFPFTPNSANFQSPTTPPQIHRFSTPVDPSNLFHSSPALPAISDSSANIVIKPFTFFNIPQKQGTHEEELNQPKPAELHGTQPQPQTSYFHDSISNKQQTNKMSSTPMSFDRAIKPSDNVQISNNFYPFDLVAELKNKRHEKRTQKSILSPFGFPPALNEVSQDTSSSKTFQHNQETPQPPILQPQLDHQTLSQPSLFESINQPALDREVRKKQTQTKRKMPKSNALEVLMSIAGDNWEQKLLTGVDNLSAESGDSFLCPEPEGHFPSPSSCSVYYQCAQGTAHKHTCQEGLAWNINTLQCDWQERVDCGLDSGYSRP